MIEGVLMQQGKQIIYKGFPFQIIIGKHFSLPIFSGGF